MSPVVTKFVRWISIPVLLIVSMFSRLAGNFEFALRLAIWMGAIFLVHRVVRSGDLVWAAAFGVVVIVFSPLHLVDQIFLFMGYTVVAIFLTLATAFRPRPLAVEL
jgi:hypothetical protein